MNCFWNGEPFECCEGFILIETEFGPCYSINSALTNPPFAKSLISDRLSGPGTLKLVAMEDIKIYLHAVDDVPYKASDRSLFDTVLWGSKKDIFFNVQEIMNDEKVKFISKDQRKCKFNWEFDPNDMFEIYNNTYSYSTCEMECYYQSQIDYCGCVHHFMPYNKKSKLMFLILSSYIFNIFYLL